MGPGRFAAALVPECTPSRAVASPKRTPSRAAASPKRTPSRAVASPQAHTVVGASGRIHSVPRREALRGRLGDDDPGEAPEFLGQQHEQVVQRDEVEQGNTEATVREVYIWDLPGESPRRVTDRLTLRTEEGAWKLWDVQSTDDQPVGG